MHSPNQPWAPLNVPAQPLTGVLASKCGIQARSGEACRKAGPASQAAPKPREGDSPSVVEAVRATGPGLAAGAAALRAPQHRLVWRQRAERVLGRRGGRGDCGFLGQAGGAKETASVPGAQALHPASELPRSCCHFLPGTLRPLEFLRTSLGGRFLVYESFLYRKEKAAGEKVYWMCRDQARLGCRSRAITQGQLVTVMRSHCHLPDLAGLEALRQRERLPSVVQQEDPGADWDGGHRGEYKRAVGVSTLPA